MGAGFETRAGLVGALLLGSCGGTSSDRSAPLPQEPVDHPVSTTWADPQYLLNQPLTVDKAYIEGLLPIFDALVSEGELSSWYWADEDKLQKDLGLSYPPRSGTNRPPPLVLGIEHDGMQFLISGAPVYEEKERPSKALLILEEAGTYWGPASLGVAGDKLWEEINLRRYAHLKEHLALLVSKSKALFSQLPETLRSDPNILGEPQQGEDSVAIRKTWKFSIDNSTDGSIDKSSVEIRFRGLKELLADNRDISIEDCGPLVYPPSFQMTVEIECIEGNPGSLEHCAAIVGFNSPGHFVLHSNWDETLYDQGEVTVGIANSLREAGLLKP